LFREHGCQNDHGLVLVGIHLAVKLGLQK
jgi:hypothetical protein